MDACVQLQKNVRDNASDLQNFMLDLKNWEEGAKQKERNVVYGIPKDDKEKKPVTRSDVEYVKTAFEDGSRQMKNKKWDLAEVSFSKAIRKYNKNPAFFIKRAKCYIKLKKPDQAEEDCISALAIDPKILKAKFLRSQAREMKGNLRGACLDLQDILILDPSNQLAKDALSRLKPLFDKSQQREDCRSFEEEEEDSTIKQGIGDSILESLAGTEDPYDVATSNDERIQIANAEKEKGNQFVKKEKWEDAKEAYSKAIEFNPNEPIFYANRALCFLKTKQEHRAILDCCMALKKNPRYVKVYMRRAAAKKATSDLWGARSDVKQVLTLEPNNSQAKADLEELNLLIEKSYDKKKEVSLSSKTKERTATVEEGKPEDGVAKNSLEYITLLPVNKPVHLRSKKPLKRIPIKFIDENLPSKKLANASSKFYLSNNEIDEIKKNVVIRETEKLDGEKTFPYPEKLLKNENKKVNVAKKAEVTPVKKEVKFSNEIKLDCKSSHKDFQYVLPVVKKPHLRSKKPLLRIPIKFI